MADVQCQQTTVSREISEHNPEKAPSPKTRRMLGFDIGDIQYGIDLSETIDVIKDLRMIQSCTPVSMTKHFLRCNRRNTLVFNLDECLTMQGGQEGHKPASFVMLDEKIQDSCVGILIPGIPTALNKSYTPTRAGIRHTAQKKIPVRSLVRNTTPGKKRGARNTVTVIDLRNLVDNCIVRMKFKHSMHHAQN